MTSPNDSIPRAPAGDGAQTMSDLALPDPNESDDAMELRARFDGVMARLIAGGKLSSGDAITFAECFNTALNLPNAASLSALASAEARVEALTEERNGLETVAGDWAQRSHAYEGEVARLSERVAALTTELRDVRLALDTYGDHGLCRLPDGYGDPCNCGWLTVDEQNTDALRALGDAAGVAPERLSGQ